MARPFSPTEMVIFGWSCLVGREKRSVHHMRDELPSFSMQFGRCATKFKVSHSVITEAPFRKVLDSESLLKVEERAGCLWSEEDGKTDVLAFKTASAPFDPSFCGHQSGCIGPSAVSCCCRALAIFFAFLEKCYFTSATGSDFILSYYTSSMKQVIEDRTSLPFPRPPPFFDQHHLRPSSLTGPVLLIL